MELQKSSIRGVVTIIIAAAVVLAVGIFDQASAADYQTKYKSIVNNYCDKYGNVNYTIKNIDGKGNAELLLTCHTGENGSGNDFLIYTYKNGKVKQQLKIIEYGLEKVKYYKKTGALQLRRLGHGGESFDYYKNKKGKYKALVSKSRQSTDGGADHNSSWSYYKLTKEGYIDKEISKKKFNRTLKGQLKGKTISTNTANWEMRYE